MSVHKDERKTGTWFAHIRYTDWTGQRRQHRKRGFPTKREALEYERNFLSKQSCTGLTMKALYDLYMEDCVHRFDKPSTVLAVKTYLARVMPFVEKLGVEQVTPQIIRNIQYKLQNAGYAGQTIRHSITYLSTMFNYGVKYLHLQNNPCHIAGSVITLKRREMTIWTQDEFLKFLAAVNPCYKTLFSVLFYTGIRIGELLALTWNDVEGNVLHITKTYNKTQKASTPPKTATSVRDVTMPGFLVDMLSRRPYGYALSDRIFPRTSAAVSYALQAGAKRAGLPIIRVHDLRHSHASMLLSAGVSIPAVSRRLGHANSKITLQVYAHALKNDDANIARLLDEKRGPRRAQ